MTKRNKTIALILFGITLLGLIVLAAGISRLEFQPGERFSLPQQDIRNENQPSNMDWIDTVLTIARVFLGLSVLLMPFYILYLIFTRQGRQDLVRLIPRLVGFVILLLIISRLPLASWFEEEVLSENGIGPGNEMFAPAPVAEFAANPPTWIINLVGVVLALVITGIAGMVILNRKRKPVDYRPFERLADEAEEAIQSLYAGKDLRETIIRCYRDMSLVLDQERGIKRDSAMTTHEFETLLRDKALPGAAIHELTHLFEEVRYGNNPPNDGDESRAISSLSAIVDALRSQG
jgi:hypothetical protein